MRFAAIICAIIILSGCQSPNNDQEIINVAQSLGGWLGGDVNSARRYVQLNQQLCTQENLGPNQTNLTAPIFERKHCILAFSVKV